MKKKKLVTLVSTLALSMVVAGTLSACGSGSGEAEESKASKAELKPYGKYKDPVTFTIGRSAQNFGDLSKTDAAKYLTEKTNIKMEVAWEAADFDQKFALALSTKDIPDVMSVNPEQFEQLIQNDLIADLSEVYDKAASDTLKERYASYTESDPLGAATRDGKLYGLPSTIPYYEETITWVRKDWLDELKLPVPETVDDLQKTMKAFVDHKMGGEHTVGFSPDPILAFDYTGQFGVEPVVNQLDAYPQSWITKDGKAVYGSTQPEMKEALQLLNQWYEDGVIDKEFATRSYDERKGLLSSGQCGIYMSPWWSGGDLSSSLGTDENAEWIAIQGPVKNKGDKFKATGPQPASRFLVVRKGYEHPEAIMRAYNNQIDYVYMATDDAIEARKKDAAKQGKDFVDFGWFLAAIDLNTEPATYSQDNFKKVKEALEKGSSEGLPGNLKIAYDNVQSYEKNRNLDSAPDYLNYTQGLANSGILDKLDVSQKAYFGTTETMKTRNVALKKLEQETFVKIIMGDAPISEFDNFVKQWNKLGGDKITEEVNKEVKAGRVQ